MDLLTKGKIYGEVQAFICTIEWQKRGLPHAHILLWLKENLSPNDIDKFISAEIPDPDLDPNLHEIVKKHMIHGPCGKYNPKSPCMKDGKCSKKFPRPFVKETQTGKDGFPLYKRRSPEDGGLSFELTTTKSSITVDNRWVVPYNSVLSRTFEAHINTEYSGSSIKAIKYICKYINKGSDQATFGLAKENDEVHKYETGRYISASEATWKILGFEIHKRYPPVDHLAIHIENGERIYYIDTDNMKEKLKEKPKTTLTGFFDLCKEDDFVKTLLCSFVLHMG